MKLSPVPLFGLGNCGKSADVTAQDRLNLYAEIQMDPEDGERLKLYCTPGLETFVDLGNNPIRGKWEFGGFVFAVCGPAVYRITSSGVATQVGLLLTSEGIVSMDDNGLQLMIADNPNGYIYDLGAATFTQITDEDFLGASTVTQLAQRFVTSVPDSGRFQWSALADGTAWDALDFATAESNSDKLVAVKATGGQLYLLGTKNTEIWGVSSDADAPYAVIGSGAVEWGLAAVASLRKTGGALTFLGQHPEGQVQVVRLAGAQADTVSSSDLDHTINGYATVSDATAIAYLMDGHPMYQINFPTADQSWFFDGSNGAWGRVGGDTTRHRADTHIVFGGKSLVGDYSSGKIYRLGAEYLTDAGEAIAREFTSRHQAAGSFTQFPELWIDMEAGVGLATGQGEDPQVMLQVSRDGGHTWGSEMWRSAGRIGKYLTRATWTRLGRSRDWVFKVRVTDPVKVVFTSAWGRFQ